MGLQHVPISLLLGLMLLVLQPVQAQNTKGDQPGRPARETRFKSKPTESKTKKTPAGRVAPQGKSKATSASRSGKPGKPLRPVYQSKPGKEKAWEGNAAGNRINVRSATGRTRNVYPQRGRFVNNPSVKPRDHQQKWHAVKPARVNVRSATGRTRNVYPQQGRFVNNPSRKPDRVEKVVSNRSYLARNQRSASLQEPPRKKRVVPSSASRAYIARKSINPYAGFWNRKQKGERAYTGDISGRRLRTKNYESPRQKVIKPATTPYYGRKRIGDRPYKGPAAGRYVTATRESRAWKGDISGRKIRGRNFSSRGQPEVGRPVYPLPARKDRFGDRPYKGTIPGGGYKSATQHGEKRAGTIPLYGTPPGKRAKGIDIYPGNIRGRKAFGTLGAAYTGSIKARKPIKGGGSVSGKLWNNRQTPIEGRAPGMGAKRIDTYQGNIKGRKTFDAQGADFTGYIKAKKPLKGGGSVSGKLWNNNEQPIPVRTPQKDFGYFPGKFKRFDIQPRLRDQGEEFAGTYKAKPPKKGGGSISGKLWNNRETPIDGKAPGIGAKGIEKYQGTLKAGRKEPDKEIGGFPGKYHRFELHPDMRDQGEEFTGFTRLSRFKRNYLKNPNQADVAIKKSRPDKTTYQADGLQVKVKRSDYVENKNADEDALRKLKPSKYNQEVAGLQVRLKRPSYVENKNADEDALRKLKPSKYNQEVAGLQVRVKEGDYKTKPLAAKGSLPGIAAAKTSVKASEYYKVIRLDWDYKHNPSSTQEALDVREPGKAFARSSDYQGNIRMKKFDLFGNRALHPDAQFVKTNKNNVKEEKDLFTNFKLWWARLFRKNETQPDNLKEKIRKPRFDKREQGLWYD